MPRTGQPIRLLEAGRAVNLGQAVASPVLRARRQDRARQQLNVRKRGIGSQPLRTRGRTKGAYGCTQMRTSAGSGPSRTRGGSAGCAATPARAARRHSAAAAPALLITASCCRPQAVRSRRAAERSSQRRQEGRRVRRRGPPPHARRAAHQPKRAPLAALCSPCRASSSPTCLPALWRRGPLRTAPRTRSAQQLQRPARA